MDLRCSAELPHTILVQVPFCSELISALVTNLKGSIAHKMDLCWASCNAGDPRFDPWVGKIPWRRNWQPTAVFLPGESHGRRSLAGYSP